MKKRVISTGAGANSSNSVLRHRDLVVELCLAVWLGSLLLGRHLDGELPWYIKLVDFAITGILYTRFERMLPRRRWRMMTYYALYYLTAFFIGFAIIIFIKDGFTFTEDVTDILIAAIVVALWAAFGAFMWRRRVVQCREILLRREMRSKRRKLAY